MRELPTNFDWVTARAACSAVKFFERLCLTAQQNVKTRNEGLTTAERQDGLSFGFDAPNAGFSVFHQGVPGKAVRFWLDGETIHVRGTDVGGREKATFSGTVTLTDEALCKLKVDGQELDEWQVLKKALEPLFFPA